MVNFSVLRNAVPFALPVAFVLAACGVDDVTPAVVGEDSGLHAAGGDSNASGGGPSGAGSGGDGPAGAGGSGSGGAAAAGGANAAGGAPSDAGAGGSSAGGVGFGGGAGSAAAGGDSATGAGGVPPSTDGKWVGLTSQDLRFELDVFAGAVLGVEFDWLVQAPGPQPGIQCTATGATETTFGTPAAMEDESFTKGPISGAPLVYTVAGSLTSNTRATGTLSITHTPANCSGSANLTWQAERVVCGDGRISWSETCDDGNDDPGDGCSQICQLDPVAEIEPNGMIAEAGSPFTADVVVTGSIPAPSDADVIAIRNPYPGTIAVQLETHGETVGTCGGRDTYLEVLDGAGTVLSQDDNSSRAWFCSLLQVPLSSGQTVYVRVTSTTGAAIPTYNLHVRFQGS